MTKMGEDNMRFERANLHDRRTIKRFALFPITLPREWNGRNEMRWMEWVWIRQTYDPHVAIRGWHSKHFVDQPSE